MRATILNAEIIGHETKTNKKGEPFTIVRYEEAGTAKPCELVDKDEERAKHYTKGKMMDLLIDIDAGPRFTTIRIIEARETSCPRDADTEYWRRVDN